MDTLDSVKLDLERVRTALIGEDSSPSPSFVHIDGDDRTPEQREQDDRARTGRVRCIGCGKFIAERCNWNQCSDCDTRYPEECW